MKKSDREHKLVSKKDSPVSSSISWFKDVLEAQTSDLKPTKTFTGTVLNAASNLTDIMFNANANVQLSMVKILACLSKIFKGKNMFCELKIPKKCAFDKFIERMEIDCERIRLCLVNGWPREISLVIRELLCDSFDFSDSSPNSRSARFLNLVNTVMEAQLREIIDFGLISYLQYFNIIVDTDTQGGSTNLHQKYIVGKAAQHRVDATLLNVSIQLYKESEDGEIGSSELDLTKLELSSQHSLNFLPSLTKIRNKIMETFNLPMACTSKCITKIETIILSLAEDTASFCASNATGSLLELGNFKLTALLDSAVYQMQITLQKYKKYEAFLHNDPCITLSDSSPLFDYEEPVKALYSARDEIEAISADFVEIAPFIIDCTKVKDTYRHFLQKAIAKISDILSQKVATACSDMLSLYETLNLKLLFDPEEDHEKWRQLNEGISLGQIEYMNFNEQVSYI